MYYCKWVKAFITVLFWQNTIRRLSLSVLLAGSVAALVPYTAYSGDLPYEKVVQKSITGQVINKETRQPLEGVSVMIKGRKELGHTDGGGLFSLDLSPNDVLEFSLVGFEGQTFVYKGGEARLIIELKPSSKNLNEVVVTALGINRSKRSLTYATQKIGGDELTTNRDGNFVNTLSGKVAGLSITPSSSGPGSASRIILRGNKSITGNNNALIVVDGVAIDNSDLVGQTNSDSHSYNGSDGVANINPDDIESVNILKGPAGAALYGSRAANGAVIITTKSGKTGRMGVNVNSGLTMDQPYTFNKLQNEFSQGNGGVYSVLSGSSWGAPITGQTVTDYTGKSVQLKAFPNNVRDFFRNGLGSNNSIAMQGGSDKTQIYLSYANNYYNGILPLNSLLRHTFDIKVNTKITDQLSVSGKVTYMLQNINNKPAVGSEGSIVSEIESLPRTVDLANVKNYKKTTADGTENQVYWATPDISNMNPYWTVYNTHRYEERSRIIGLLSAKYDIFNWLSIQGRISSDGYYDFNRQIYANNTNVFAPMKGGYYDEMNNFVAERNSDVLLSGNNTIAKNFKITYNVGASVLSRQYRMRSTVANGLSIPNQFDLSFATNLTQSSQTVKRQLQAGYATAQISYKDFLFLDGSARKDWSSTLPEPYSYFYPSIGLNVILSEMFHLPDWIYFAKVRGSYARVGNDADPYLLAQTYNYYPGSFGGFIASSTVQAIGNLKPELTTSQEFGTEWKFFENKLGIDVTYYKSNSKNQLMNISAASSSGYTAKYINAGNVQNSGIEIMLSATPVNNGNFQWNTYLNFARNTSKIIELAPGVSRYYFSDQGVRSSVPGVEVGGQYGDLFGYKWNKNDKGQYLIDANGLPMVTPSIEKLGNYNPRFSLGLNNTFTYKNWFAGVLIEGRFGGVISSGTASQNAYSGSSDYTLAHRNDTWVLPGAYVDGSANTTPINAEKFWTTVSQGLYSWSEFFTYNATNVRLREASLGYRFTKLPVRVFKSAQISLIGRNLLFFYRGKSLLDIPGIGRQKVFFDPEVGLGAGNYQGLEFNTLPSTRNYGINLKLTF